MASVTKRGNKWSLRYRVTDERGVVTHHRISFNTKEEAWENARTLEAASESGINVHGSKMTCGQLMEKWYSEHVVYLEANTQSRYSAGIDRMVDTFVYDLPVKKLSAAAHASLIDDLMNGDENHGPIKAITAKSITDPLRYSVNWAARNGLILINPLQNAKLPKIPKREQRILNEADVQDILNDASDRFRIPLMLALYGGLRRGECSGLRWSDIDFSRGTLTIVRSVVKLKNGQEVLKDSPKSSASRRTITMPKFVMNALAAAPKKGEYVCLSKTGEPYKLQRYPAYTAEIIKRINARREAANILPIPQATFHDMRHTHAAMLIKMGIQPKVISERLGHTSITITMDTYGYLMEGLQSGVADALDQHFQEQSSGHKSGNNDPKVGTKTGSFCKDVKTTKDPQTQV